MAWTDKAVWTVGPQAIPPKIRTRFSYLNSMMSPSWGILACQKAPLEELSTYALWTMEVSLEANSCNNIFFPGIPQVISGLYFFSGSKKLTCVLKKTLQGNHKRPACKCLETLNRSCDPQMTAESSLTRFSRKVTDLLFTYMLWAVISVPGVIWFEKAVQNFMILVEVIHDSALALEGFQAGLSSRLLWMIELP